MKQLCLADLRTYVPHVVLALVLACLLPSPTAHASSELVPATEVTATYNPLGYLQRLFSGLKPVTRPVTTARIDELAKIEPAAGGAKSEGHGGDSGGHGGGHEPKATGKSEGKKSFTGKVIGAVPEIPDVTIGGKTIISEAERKVNELNDTTPEGLRETMFLQNLDRRFSISPYAHSPRRGPRDAPITAIVFSDFSCGQCMPELAKVDATLAAHASNTQVIHIHAPTVRFQDTNMPAFYGKVAARGGVFWAFRDKLIAKPTDDANALFDNLVASGMDIGEARSLMLTDARRFYRELDADSLLARSFSISNPPVVFLNGIRVGYGGIPLEKLPEVLQYISQRLQRGLDEPPK